MSWLEGSRASKLSVILLPGRALNFTFWNAALPLWSRATEASAPDHSADAPVETGFTYTLAFALALAPSSWFKEK